MNDQMNTSGDSLLNEQNKDTNLNGLNPNFEFEKKGIGVKDIKAENEQILKLINEAKDNETNRFPFEVFPKDVQEIIIATNRDLNFPIDFIGASMLFAVSVAVGNTHRVEVKKGWLESAVLYLAIVAPPGTNKSHPLSWATQPIVDKDKKTYILYEELLQKYEREVNLTKKERDKEGIGEPRKPFWNKFLLSDFTPEALAEVHKHNKRGIGVYVDELAGWFKNFNRYNKGSEMEFWLSVWSGKPIYIDRKTGEPVYVPFPFIPVCGTIQNAILNELAKESRSQNGFIHRLLFAILDKLQKEYWSETELDSVVSENWQIILSKLLYLSIAIDETSNPKPEILRFTTEAKLILFEWQKANTDQSNNAKNEEISGIYSKLEIYAVRLSLILEMLFYACNESDKKAISVKSIQGALKLVEYFKNSALKVNSIISNASPLDKHPADRQELYKALPDKFTTEIGLQIAVGLGIPERSCKRFLKEKELFNWLSRGNYEKCI
ncbi:MAG: YfjI family protein [Saprospiraceae bacterium]